MAVSTKRYLTGFAATAVLGLGLYGCGGGGGGDGPQTGGILPGDGDGMTPDDPLSAEGLAGAIGLAVNLDDVAPIDSNIGQAVGSIRSGSDYYGVSQAYSEYGGRDARAIPWRNDANELSFDADRRP